MFIDTQGLVVARAGQYDVLKDKIKTQQYLSNYILKSEIPKEVDLSGYAINDS